MPGIGTSVFAELDAQTQGDSSGALAAATYGPPAAGRGGAFSPGHGVGAGFWLAVGGVVVLVLIRQSLPR